MTEAFMTNNWEPVGPFYGVGATTRVLRPACRSLSDSMRPRDEDGLGRSA